MIVQDFKVDGQKKQKREKYLLEGWEKKQIDYFYILGLSNFDGNHTDNVRNMPCIV